jgi:hypothetical protein
MEDEVPKSENKDKKREILICPFALCVVSREVRVAGACEWSILDKQGYPDCGYG